MALCNAKYVSFLVTIAFKGKRKLNCGKRSTNILTEKALAKLPLESCPLSFMCIGVVILNGNDVC